MTEDSRTPAERLEELTTLYERHAYAVWNVAWRTALDHRAAMDAARRAFMAQVATPASERLAGDAARLAVELAGPVDPRAIDDPVLAATARLAAVQRAVLALTSLVGEQAVAGLGVDAPTGDQLGRLAQEQLGTLLGAPPAEALQACGELAWEEPPDELWETLYPELHAAVTSHARTLQAASFAAEAPPAAAPRRRTMPGIPRVALVPVALLAVAGVAWAASGGDSGSGSAGSAASGDSEPSTPVFGGSSGTPEERAEAEQGKRAAPQLSPEELDRLRQEEIEDLKRFTERKADRSLPRGERRRAARRVDDLVDLARRRQKAAERRELALRRALARERAARMREESRRREAREDQRRPAPAPTPQRTSEQPKQQPERRDSREDDARAGDEAQAECLYNEADGSYICPE